MYQKKCVLCSKEFSSESRNTRYCSPECAQRGAKKSVKIQKARKKRRDSYSADKDLNRLKQRSYSIALELADRFIPHVCKFQGDDCSGDLQCHHLDVNPFNNTIQNLCWVCEHHHAELHSKVERRNIVNEIKEYAEEMRSESVDR